MRINSELKDLLRQEWDEKENGCSFDTGLESPEKSVWWRCTNNHIWNTRIDSRVKKKSGCPYCTGVRAIKGENDVATLYPNLAIQFHPTKNGNKKLDMYKESSGKKVWWRCNKGHEWEAAINTRTKRGYGCPICSNQMIVYGINDLKTLYPGIAKEISPTGNKGIDLNTLSSRSTKKIVWLCPRGHEYSAAIAKRTVRGDGCPYCAGRYPIKGENDLETLHPEVKKYWNAETNGHLDNYTHASGKRVTWKCEQGHAWIRSIKSQVDCNDCPYCSGRCLIMGVNDVATVYPELVSEWDVEANGKEAIEVKAGSKVFAFWRCKQGHLWKANIGNRIKGKGCPYCAGRYPVRGENDLETLFPWLVKEWNFDLNHKRPDDYLPKSNCKVWWKCENGHTWKALISERTRGTGCPKCRKGR